MRTRITDLLGIRHPIILAPANYVGTPEMVAAVSSAGGFGIMASGRLAPDDLRTDIQAIRKLTDKPFGANLIFGSPAFEKQAEVLVELKVPLICHSRGNPKWIIDAAKGRVWRITATDAELDHLKENYPVISTVPAAQGYEMRVVADDIAGKTGSPVDPNLEDAYIYFMQTQGYDMNLEISENGW